MSCMGNIPHIIALVEETNKLITKGGFKMLKTSLYH